MSSGRSSCSAFRAGAGTALCAALLALAPAGVVAPQVPLPPPPDELDPRGSEARPAKPERSVPRHATCPRCGYLCERGWHYCIACGWDLTRLVGDAEERALQTIARVTVGLTVTGRPNRHATAFPYGGEDLFLTNARILIGADRSRLKVRTFNNREYTATPVGYDLPSGVGLIRVEAPDLTPLESAPSPTLQDSAWAICYPIRLEDDLVRYLPVSLHRGRITATGQVGTFLVSFENLLRTDHAIENGCTGGPLIDARGRLAGMILGGPEDGITYVQPLEGLQPILAALVAGESPARPFFGLGLVAPDERRRARFGLPPAESRPLVAYLIRGSPAASAGVQPGDLLVAVGGEKVATVRAAGARLLAADPKGPGVTLALERAGAGRQITINPIGRPERVLLDPIDELQEALEVNLQEVSTGPGESHGLLVKDLVRGGRGEKARFRNGDRIVRVNEKPVKSFAAFDTQIRSRFKEIFADGAGADRRFASSYLVLLEVRTEKNEKVTRDYVNLFPDFLAPPVY
jgi:S1-C subfamily serine protease